MQQARLDRVHTRLDNLRVLLEVAILTPKEYAQRRNLIIEEAVDGATLSSGDDEQAAPLKRAPVAPVATLEREAGKRPVKRARLSDFEYYNAEGPFTLVVDAQDDGDDSRVCGDEGSSYSDGASHSSSSTSSSSGGVGESSEDEATSELTDDEATTPPSAQIGARNPLSLFSFVRATALMAKK